MDNVRVGEILGRLEHWYQATSEQIPDEEAERNNQELTWDACLQKLLRGFWNLGHYTGLVPLGDHWWINLEDGKIMIDPWYLRDTAHSSVIFGILGFEGALEALLEATKKSPLEIPVG